MTYLRRHISARFFCRDLFGGFLSFKNGVILSKTGSRLVKSRVGVRPKSEYQKPRYVQPRSPHSQEQCARHCQQQASHHITTDTQDRSSHAEKSRTISRRVRLGWNVRLH